MDSTEHSNISTLEFLSEGQLHESYWETDCEEAEEVWNEEESSSPFEAKVWETPEVSKSDTVANHSKNEGCSGQPTGTLDALIFILKDSIANFLASHWIENLLYRLFACTLLN